MNKYKPPFRRRRKLMWELIVIQEGHCFYCDRTVTVPQDDTFSRLNATLDHKIPQHLGGKWTLANLVVACWDCNHKKAGWVLPDELFNDRKQMQHLFKSGKIKHYMRDYAAASQTAA